MKKKRLYTTQVGSIAWEVTLLSFNGYTGTYTKNGDTYDKDLINKEIELMETDE